MAQLERLMDMLCGTFDNKEQCRAEDVAGNRIHPKAKHIIGICNDRIDHLPKEFLGCFVIEESYFDMGDRVIEKHYLFSYVEQENGTILLTSYDVPDAIQRTDLTNENGELRLDFRELRISPRFQPMELEEDVDGFFGENISQFSQDTLFHYSLTVRDGVFYARELLERKGVPIAGYEEPTVYIRTN